MSTRNDPVEIVAAGGNWIRTTDGRVVAYSRHGSTDTNAPIVVNPYMADYHAICGNKDSDSSGNNTLLDYQNISYAVITISLPGIGHSDLHPGLDVIEWPKTDLLPILEKEGVDRFHIFGVSLGSLYATAAAQVLGERIISLGLRVPFLPLSISEEFNLPRGQETLPKTKDVEKNTFTVRLVHLVLKISITLFGNPGRFGIWCMKTGLFGASEKSTARFFEEYPNEAKYFSILIKQFSPLAMMYLCSEDVALEAPGLDHRLIDDKLISLEKRMVWYASDDTDCPPSHGKWLAEEGWKGCGNVRVFDNYNHPGGATIDYSKFMETLIKL